MTFMGKIKQMFNLLDTKLVAVIRPEHWQLTIFQHADYFTPLVSQLGSRNAWRPSPKLERSEDGKDLTSQLARGITAYGGLWLHSF